MNIKKLMVYASRILPTPGDMENGWRYGVFRRRLPVPVNDRTALTISTVWGCIRFIQGGIGPLPWPIYQNRANGKGADERKGHPAYWLLNKRPNEEMSATVFRELFLLWVLVFGNAYAEIEWDRAGRPINLWPIHPRRVTPSRRDDGTLYYRIQNVSGEVELEKWQMFHIPGMSFDGIVGLPVIEYAARTLGLAIGSEEYGSGFFSNSGVPSSVITHPKTLSKPAQGRLIDRLKQKGGVYDSQDTMILEEGMELKPVGLPPEQAQFLETRRFTVEDVCRWFGVPPSKVGHFEKISYNSAEQLTLDVVAECFMPWVKKFEQEADYKLLTDNHSNYYSKLDLRALMRATHVDRANYYKTMAGSGFFSINDVLELEDMNPITNGDLHLVPLNMAPLDDVATGKYEPGIKTGTAQPNPPQPPSNRLSLEDEKRNQRLLQYLDKRLDDIEEFERNENTKVISNEGTNAKTLLN